MELPPDTVFVKNGEKILKIKQLLEGPKKHFGHSLNITFVHTGCITPFQNVCLGQPWWASIWVKTEWSAGTFFYIMTKTCLKYFLGVPGSLYEEKTAK